MYVQGIACLIALICLWGIHPAAAAKPHGGYALPLHSYAPEVWKNFIFDQEAEAELIGASPNILPADLAKQLYQLVEDGRPR